MHSLYKCEVFRHDVIASAVFVQTWIPQTWCCKCVILYQHESLKQTCCDGKCVVCADVKPSNVLSLWVQCLCRREALKHVIASAWFVQMWNKCSVCVQTWSPQTCYHCKCNVCADVKPSDKHVVITSAMFVQIWSPQANMLSLQVQCLCRCEALRQTCCHY